MDVVSACPLPVASVLWQPRPGKWALTFVCKATYRLAPTESELASEQEPPNEDENYWDDDITRSLYAPSDLVPFKARADVILVGHAFAPRREPARSIVAELMVGSMSKAIECFGDRSWTLDGQLREGPRFTKIPLRYERAAGGPETSNPVGMRPDAADGYGMVHLPNLQPPGKHISQRGEVIEPIGFGPIAPAWPTRVAKLGRHAATWFKSAWNSQPMPDSLDPSFFNCAPADQQLSQIRPSERLILENLHPEHQRLVTNLPGTVPVAVLERAGAAPEPVRLKADTLWIDTDRSLCTLVWRGRISVDHPAQAGRIVISIEGAGGARKDAGRLGWKDVSKPVITAKAPAGLAPRPHLDEDVTHVPELYDEASGGVLPFIKAGEEMDDGDPWRDTTAVQIGQQQEAPSALPFTNMNAGMGEAKSALPFQARPPQPSMPAIDTGTMTMRAVVEQPAPQPPPVPVPQAPLVAPPALSAVQPPPLVRPPPTMDPIAPAMAPTSPWARSGPGAGPAPMPSLGQPPPPAPVDPAPQGATFLPTFEPPKIVSASPVATATAATAGAVAASNAAAMNAAVIAARQATPSQSVSPSASAQAPRTTMTREVLTLLWFEPSFVKPISEKPPWAEILAKPDEEDEEDAKKKKKNEPEIPPDVDTGEDEDIDESEHAMFGEDSDASSEPDPEEDVPQEVRDKRAIFKVIARGEPSSAAGVNQEVIDGIKKDGTLEPPLVLVAGELLFPFDELETLKATVTAVSPLVAGDKKLKEVVDTVNELLKTPWLSRSGSVAEGLTGRIKEAFGQGNRMVPPSYLQEHTERMLLEERHYQKRTIFGQTWLRTLFTPAFSQDPIPTYLPEALTKQLPMFQRLKTRLIAEVHMQQDQYETNPIALRVVALARVTGIPQAAGGGGSK
jgi:hypothetical protein